MTAAEEVGYDLRRLRPKRNKGELVDGCGILGIPKERPAIT